MKQIKKFQLTFAILIISVIALNLIVMFATTSAFISYQREVPTVMEIGNVKVELIAYFEKDGVIYSENIDYIAETPTGDTFTKFGVIKVDITDRDAIQFAENFRVDIKIYSNVNSYIRIAPYEQLTLTYQAGDVTREVAIVQDGYTEFNYTFYDELNNPNGKFYDNRSIDGFIYCQEMVKRIDENTPLTITLIDDYFTDRSFGTRDSRYKLQIGFIIEAVQYYEGPIHNWNLEHTPWGTEW